MLTEKPFGNHKILQEFPVHLINPDFTNKLCKYDFVIRDMNLVIEVMGKQHTFLTLWSKDQTREDAIATLHNTQDRDYKKKQAAIDMGYTYIELSYQEINSPDFTGHWLLAKINETKKEQGFVEPKKVERKPVKQKNIYAQKMKVYRQKFYKEAKQRYKMSRPNKF